MVTQTDKLLALKKLVDTFHRNKEHYLIQGYKEQRLRMDFVDKFFALFDWDVSNEEGIIEEFRDVLIEDNVEIQGNQKNPDYSFRIGNEIVFFVETKKPSVNIKEDIHPAFQLRRYGYTAKRKISVLTDFHEFAIYDTSVKPNKNDKASSARLFYCTYEEYEKNWDFLYGLLAKENVKKGSINNYIGKGTKKGSSEVDKEFLKLIEGWRSELAKNIAINNKKLDIDSLNLAVQKIIDRIIFLRICEEKGIEQYENLLNIAGEKSAYVKLVLYFDKANKKYNSEIFKPDEQANALNIDDDVLQDIIINLYYPECPYAFSVLPVEILGNIYEQFLGKTIRLTDSHQAKIEEKPEVRKAGGVYYTPKYIVDYIVNNTVGEKIKGLPPKDIEKIKILDPACGSGSFLLGAFTSLLVYHLVYYTKKENLAKALKNEVIYPFKKNSYRLTIKTKQNILLNNIYGVDIDAQAVEVTKLSLMLKLLEGESDESAGKLFKYSETKLLPTLTENIKCGNSLIGLDFYKDKNLSLFEREDMKKINAFDWQKEFSGIFQAGGFDCIIGNPPYLKLTINNVEGSIYDYYNSHYSSLVGGGSKNLFQLFIEKTLSLKPSDLSFIVPEALLTTSSNKMVRDLMLKTLCLKKLVIFEGFVFEDATIGSTIFVLSDSGKEKPVHIEKLLSDGRIEGLKTMDLNVKSDIWGVMSKSEYLNLLDKISSKSINMKELVSMSKGMVVEDRKKQLRASPNKKDLPFLLGSSIGRYIIKSNYYANYNNLNIIGGTRDLSKHMHTPRLLIRRTGASLCVVYSTDKSLIESTLYILISDKIDLKLLLAILNSKLLSFYLNQKLVTNSQGFPQILMGQLDQLPIRLINEKNIKERDIANRTIKLVDQMLETQEKAHSAKTESNKKLYKQKIDMLDNQIDGIVYEIYGLTKEEIAIVESNI